MTYSFHLNIPEDSIEGQAIAFLIEHNHVSAQVAAQQLIRGAVEAGLTPRKRGRKDAGPKPHDLVIEALRKVELVRAERAVELAKLSTQNDSAGTLIGFLKDEPELVGAIREASKERRRATYS